MAVVTVALLEMNWSTGTEIDIAGEDTAGEPRRVAAVLIGTKAEIATILEKRESWHK